MSGDTAQPERSFSKGVGEWIGAAHVYDGNGSFLGTGTDTRTVEADDATGRVTINVTFDGPFNLSGVYTIADHGSHRVYEGPLNYGFADALGNGLVAAHNYWPDIGLTQRFFLMVLPGGSRQMSLALITRGEQLRYAVVGEYQRQIDPSQPLSPPSDADPEVSLLHRTGIWAGELTLLDGDLSPGGTTPYEEVVDASLDGVMTCSLKNTGFARDASLNLRYEADGASTSAGDVVGSYSLFGGRAISGSFHHYRDQLRVWRREVVARDGSLKAVLHTWYRGEQRVGVAHGVLARHGS